MTFCAVGMITGMVLILLGIYGLTAPFIDRLRETSEEITLDLEDFDKNGRRMTILGVIVLLASLGGLLTCYFGQYIGMIAFSIYLAISTLVMAAVILHVTINFSEIRDNTKAEARRFWKIAREANDFLEEIERTVSPDWMQIVHPLTHKFNNKNILLY